MWIFLLGNKLYQCKASSRSSVKQVVLTEGIDLSMNQSEPWTVLAHKKPQKGWIPYNPRTMRPPPLAKDTKFVKLMSWNVNGLRALLKLESFSALELAQREDFDVLCLQETKLQAIIFTILNDLLSYFCPNYLHAFVCTSSLPFGTLHETLAFNYQENKLKNKGIFSFYF